MLNSAPCGMVHRHTCWTSTDVALPMPVGGPRTDRVATLWGLKKSLELEWSAGPAAADRRGPFDKRLGGGAVRLRGGAAAQPALRLRRA